MAMSTKPLDGRIFIIAGLADVAIGLALAWAAMTGRLGANDLGVLAFVGFALAAVGFGVVAWGATHISRAADRRGDLN